MKKGIDTTLSSFEDLINRNCLYVDKTEHLYNLITSSGTYYFLSRPRRFGKSLTVSTLEAIFKGKKELFKNLYIGQTDYDFKEYPVIHLDFSQCQNTTTETIDAWIKDRFSEIAREHNVAMPRKDRSSSDNFVFLIKDLSKKGKVVVLIDEYDNRLTENYNKSNIFEIRDLFRGFFSVLKSLGAYLRFVLLTGVTKYAKMGVFSSLNNLNDISLNRDYATMLGFTQEELESNFKEYIDEGVKKKGYSREQYLKELKDTYDGYRFAINAETVYNPVSIGLFFSEGGELFNDYWAETGGNTELIMDVAKKVNYNVDTDLKRPLSRTILVSNDIVDITSDDNSNPRLLTSLMFQAGYLTIDKQTDYDDTMFTVKFPNQEVRDTFTKGLISLYLGSSTSDDLSIPRLLKCFKRGATDEAIELMKSTYASIPNVWLPHMHEAYYQLGFYCMMLACDADIDVEVSSSKGRADAVLKTDERIYVIEFKLDKTADEALAQIKEKGYYEKYNAWKKTKPVHLVGIGFSSTDRNITDYREEILPV